MLTSARSVFLHCSRATSVTSRTVVYGPVRTVVWRGSAGDCRPMPFSGSKIPPCSVRTPPQRQQQSIFLGYSALGKTPNPKIVGLVKRSFWKADLNEAALRRTHARALCWRRRC